MFLCGEASKYVGGCVCLSVCFILPLLYKFVCLLKRIAQQYQKGLARFTLLQEWKYTKKYIFKINLYST